VKYMKSLVNAGAMFHSTWHTLQRGVFGSIQNLRCTSPISNHCGRLYTGELYSSIVNTSQAMRLTYGQVEYPLRPVHSGSNDSKTSEYMNE
jgi:hypothetical protein